MKTLTMDQIVFVLSAVIKHLQEREPTRTLTACKLISPAIFQAEATNATRH